MDNIGDFRQHGRCFTGKHSQNPVPIPQVLCGLSAVATAEVTLLSIFQNEITENQEDK